jgi:hypothetical protein
MEYEVMCVLAWAGRKGLRTINPDSPTGAGAPLDRILDRLSREGWVLFGGRLVRDGGVLPITRIYRLRRARPAPDPAA